jgi:lipopolysaccharide/colanic/teichoic acid biosynthesis glycosyltransferase
VSAVRALIEAEQTRPTHRSALRSRPGETPTTLAADVVTGLTTAVAVVLVMRSGAQGSSGWMVAVLATWGGFVGATTALVFRLFEERTWRRPRFVFYCLIASGSVVGATVAAPIAVLAGHRQVALVIAGFTGSTFLVGSILTLIRRTGRLNDDNGEETVPIDVIERDAHAIAKVITGSSSREWARRLLDVVGALLLLAVTLPLMLVVAIAVKLESRGQLLYHQSRVGTRGDVFRLRKFRSMVADAEADGIARWAEADDPRVTRVGRLMRRLRIDELPQLLDVLAGRMSLVGPRPERPEFVEGLRLELPAYDLRHLVKPGITGWAQVRFRYAASIDETAQKLEYDIFYAMHRSLLLDLKILADTVPVVLLGIGAQ